MTRKLSLTTAVAVAALSVGAPAALAKPVPALPQPDPMIEDGFAQAVAKQQSIWMAEDGFDRAVAAKLALQSTPRLSPDTLERLGAVTRPTGSPVLRYSDSADGATLSVQGEPQSMTALRIRSEGLNKKYGLGEYATSSPRFSDSADGAIVAGGTEATVVSATGSGTEIEWPQVGIGLGIGILLALGLGLIMRAVHIRPFAH